MGRFDFALLQLPLLTLLPRPSHEDGAEGDLGDAEAVDQLHPLLHEVRTRHTSGEELTISGLLAGHWSSLVPSPPPQCLPLAVRGWHGDH